MMKPKFNVILEQALEEGVLRGYRRAFKHNEDPSEEIICDDIWKSCEDADKGL